MILRNGYTTGACASAAAKAAVSLLCGNGEAPREVEIFLPDGESARFVVADCRVEGVSAVASVRKNAGDDPDITHQAEIVAAVRFAPGDDITFAAGEGVGTVTKPGLSVPPGEPAINPGPRAMIRQALRQVTARGLHVTISVPGGRDLATRTFNPRLGIEGGISIIGTTGIVKPFSVPAMESSLACALDVAAACGVREPVLVPGNIGERAARKLFCVTDGQVVQVSNHWGFMLDYAAELPFERLLVLGHPGKLAKLADGEWDTHSSNSASAVATVARIANIAEPESPTVEGIFASLPPDQSSRIGNTLAAAIRSAIAARLETKRDSPEAPSPSLSVVLVNMAGEILGTDGDLSPWLPERTVGVSPACDQDPQRSVGVPPASEKPSGQDALAPIATTPCQ